MDEEQKVWEDEVMIAPLVDDFRRALWGASMKPGSVFLPFTFRDFGEVNVLISEGDEILVPLHLVRLVGTVRQPIKRWFGFLSPNEVRMLRLVIVCFPDNPSEKDTVEITELGTQKI